MTSVLDFPVAEQYPSRTETSSTATSKRSSVISVTTTGKKKPTPKGRQSRCGRTTMQRHRRCSCDWLCRDGAAQNGPVDIRPEVLAAHNAAGGALDCRASFGRNVLPFQPVVDRLLVCPDCSGQLALRPKDRDCFVQCVHANDDKHVCSTSQHTKFLFLNTCCSVRI